LDPSLRIQESWSDRRRAMTQQSGEISLIETHHQAAAVRSSFYAKLSEVLAYPTSELRGEVATGELRNVLSELIEQLPYDFSVQDLACFELESVDAMESEYIRLFDLPVDGPPCPLYGGLLGGDRRQVMEELLRLYRHFGLSTADAAVRDLPDSIPTVLEFLQFLTQREASAGNVNEAAPLRTAQRDLLERHLTRWIPRIIEQLQARKPMPLYLVGMTLTGEFAGSELQQLNRHGESPSK